MAGYRARVWAAAPAPTAALAHSARESSVALVGYESAVRGTPKFLRSPVRLGITYLLLIPAFATLFWAQPANSFRDTNIEHEAAVHKDAASVLGRLTDALRAHTRGPAWKGDFGFFHIIRGSVRAAALRHTTDGRVLLEVSGNAVNDRRHPIVDDHFQVWVQVLQGRARTIFASGDSTVSLPVTLTNPDGGRPARIPVNPPVSVLLPVGSPFLPAPARPSDNGLLQMPGSTYNAFVRFFNAAEGDPYYASDRWFRMAYLSAVTVTTLGFGDITPVSTSARLLIAMEAVLGIVLIGLFVNAAVADRRRVAAAG